MTTYENLRVARRGPIVSIAAYLLLTIAKLIAGHFLNSSSLIQIIGLDIGRLKIYQV